MRDINIQGVTRDQLQARRLHLPKGDIVLADGRKLRPILGYRDYLMKRVPVDDYTKASFVELGGWNHSPTNFLVTGAVGTTDKWGLLLHVSMSYPDHDPTWDEIKAVRAAFFPADVDAMMMLPRQSNFVNVHQHCFHLWQTPQEWDIS